MVVLILGYALDQTTQIRNPYMILTYTPPGQTVYLSKVSFLPPWKKVALGHNMTSSNIASVQ